MADFGIALGRERDYRRLARHRLLDVGYGFLPEVVLRHERDDWQLLVEQRYRAVLHLARGIGLGVEVGYFLELERALERRRVGYAAADEEESARVGEVARERLYFLFAVEHRGLFAGNVHERRDEALFRVRVKLSAQLCEVKSEQCKYRYLRGECLSRGYAYFRPSRRDERVADLAVNRRSADVRDDEALGAAGLREPSRVQRVRRLAGL